MILLPLLFAAVAWWAYRRSGLDLRDSLLRTLITVGVVIFATTELLSSFSALTFVMVSMAWAIATAGALLVFFLLPQRNPALGREVDTSDRYTIACLSIIGFALLIVLITGRLSPPNTGDSMTYHLARVMHWIQNRSIRFYPTHIVRQLYSGPLAEYGILHLQILNRGSDTLAYLVQWVSWVGVICSASKCVSLLGFGKIHQLGAAVLAATLPMAILQASSTQTDLVMTFFVISGIYFFLRSTLSQAQSKGVLLFAAMAFGLATLTKAGAPMFFVPFVAWGLWSTFKTSGLRPAAKTVALLAVGFALFTAPHFTRNLLVFHHPVSHPIRIRYLSMESHSPGPVLSNMIRNFVNQLGTPSNRVNRTMVRATYRLHRWLGLDPSDLRSTFPQKTQFGLSRMMTHEDFAGDFVQLLSVLLLIPWAYLRVRNRRLKVFGLCTFAGFLLFCWFLKWQPWGNRLMLCSTTLLTVPLAIAMVECLRNPKKTVAAFVVVFVLASPCYFLNRTRSFFSLPPALSSHWTSMFAYENPEDGYFVANRGDLGRFKNLVRKLGEMKCANIGVWLSMNDWEYPLHALLRKTQGSVVIRHVEVTNSSAVLDQKVDPSESCAVVYIDYPENQPPGPAAKNRPLIWHENGISIFSSRRADFPQ